jgi:HAD superfamily hydrolase (TIGR01509 family)
MIKAVVFDMDGLLVDSEPLWQRARIEAFGAERLRWTEADQERIMGRSTQAWGEYLAEKLDHAYAPAEIIERVVLQMERYYRADLPLLPGALEVVAQLAGRWPLGLASGSSYRLIRAVLDGAGWAGAFDEVLSGDDMANGKPAPDIYLEIARRLKVAPDQIAVFEDSANGLLAGLAAGAKVIAVPHSYHRPAAEVLGRADLVLDSLRDFSPDMLARWS